MRRFIADVPDVRTRLGPHRRYEPKVLLDLHPDGRHVAALDTDAMTIRERDVVTEVPAGWLPQHSPLVDNEVMGEPEFTGIQTCRIVLPTGAIVSFELPVI